MKTKLTKTKRNETKRKQDEEKKTNSNEKSPRPLRSLKVKEAFPSPPPPPSPLDRPWRVTRLAWPPHRCSAPTVRVFRCSFGASTDGGGDYARLRTRPTGPSISRLPSMKTVRSPPPFIPPLCSLDFEYLPWSDPTASPFVIYRVILHVLLLPCYA